MVVGWELSFEPRLKAWLEPRGAPIPYVLAGTLISAIGFGIDWWIRGAVDHNPDWHHAEQDGIGSIPDATPAT